MAGNVTGRVAVIGAGYAGLAAAVELADAGIKVDVFEASRTLGGRARAIEIKDELGGLTVDNGAHILVGAYRETLRLMAKVVPSLPASLPQGEREADCLLSPLAGEGLRERGFSVTALQRLPLHLEFPGQMKLVAPPHYIPAPAPLHLAWALLTAQGLSLKEKLAAIRFMRAQQARNFRLAADMTAAELFADQPERLRRYLWEPLCLAALNTPVAIASAQVFLNVLRDSLAADRAASDLLLPATDFSSLFPEPAARYLAAHGSRVLRSTRITEIAKVGAGPSQADAPPVEPGLRARGANKVGAGGTPSHPPPRGARERGDTKVGAGRSQADAPPVGGSEPGLRARGANKVGASWTASHHDKTHGPYDHLILAVAPYHLAKLLAPHPEFAPLCRQIEDFHWQPIVTAYLAYPPAVRLPFPMIGVEGGHAQWLFDRGALCGQNGLIAAVISGDGPHLALDHEELAAAIHTEIARLLPGLPPPQRSWVIEEKRASFACTPDLQRPPTATACANVWLAGDYVAGDYPATLEGAIRSGVSAAQSVLREPSDHQP